MKEKLIKKHLTSIHGTIPFFFKRFYYVFSFGVDKRDPKKPVEKEIQELRVITSRMKNIFILGFALLFFISWIFLFVYLLITILKVPALFQAGLLI